MITVSTSETAERTYHHGDLRAALLEAGLEALKTQEFGELSLRQLAREVGVSPTAVYRHFPDKDALLGALAERAIGQLADWQLSAATKATTQDAFAATGRAYVRWALANPALFRLVFGKCGDVGDTVFGRNEAAQMLRRFAEQHTGSEAGTQRLMVQAWAVVHGLAMLILDGHLPASDTLIDSVIDARTLFAT